MSKLLNPLKILCVTNHPTSLDSFVGRLSLAGVEVVLYFASDQAQVDELMKARYHAILADFRLITFPPLKVFESVNDGKHPIPFVVIFGENREETIVEYIKMGIDEYISAERMDRFEKTLMRVIETSHQQQTDRLDLTKLPPTRETIALYEAEIQRLKERILQLASHEFRTPLATILSSASLLEMAQNRMSEDKQLDHYRRIQNTVRRMNSLLEEILTLNNVVANDEFSPEMIDIWQFFRELRDEVQSSTRTNHRVDLVWHSDIVQGVMDMRLLRDIFMNLTVNAIKLSPENSTVTLTVGHEENYLLITVKDEGGGIDTDELRYLFEPFHLAPNQYQGLGLALAIVARAVRRHQGKIQVHSELGKGTTFTVSLPWQL